MVCELYLSKAVTKKIYVIGQKGGGNRGWICPNPETQFNIWECLVCSNTVNVQEEIQF